MWMKRNAHLALAGVIPRLLRRLTTRRGHGRDGAVPPNRRRVGKSRGFERVRRGLPRGGTSGSAAVPRLEGWNRDGRREVEGQNHGYAGKGGRKENQVGTEGVFKRIDLTAGSCGIVILQISLRQKSQHRRCRSNEIGFSVRSELAWLPLSKTPPPPLGGKAPPSPGRERGSRPCQRGRVWELLEKDWC